MTTPKFIRVKDGVEVSLAEIDNQLCIAFNKESSKLKFSDEYFMLIDIADVVCASGVFSFDIYENIMARFEVLCKNKEYFENFREQIFKFLKDDYIYSRK